MNWHFCSSCITNEIRTPPIRCAQKQILIRLICIFDTFNRRSRRIKKKRNNFCPTPERIIDKVKGCDWFHPLRVISANGIKNVAKRKDTETERNKNGFGMATRWRFTIIFILRYVNVPRAYIVMVHNIKSHIYKQLNGNRIERVSPLAVVRCGHTACS